MKAKFHLDPRLSKIASMVRRGERAADVGTDHGYLICQLTADGVVPGGLALDLNKKPLARAAQTIREAGLSGRIECRLSDGLSAVGEQEAGEIIIAGMGGEAIAGILSRCCWTNLDEKHFLLQPMTRAPFLRRWLVENGYRIETERAVKAGGRLYTVISAFYDGEPRRCGLFFQYAGALTGDPSAEAGEFLCRMAATLQRKAAGIAGGRPKEAKELERLAGQLRRTAGQSSSFNDKGGGTDGV